MTALATFLQCHYKRGRMWAIRPPVFRTTWKETIAVLTQSTEKYQPILQAARQLYESEPDWVTFFREILGVDGIVRRQFTRLEDLTAFEKSQEFEQIQKWLVKLREQKNATDTESEPTRVITVRLPKSMHEYLRTEAHDLRTSMNKLCISKVLQVIDEEMIPNERASGSTGASSASTGSTGHTAPATLPVRPHQAVASTPSPYGQHQPTPPFKSAQSRF
jgi:predicted HicB family RNase H-like nuclease